MTEIKSLRATVFAGRRPSLLKIAVTGIAAVVFANAANAQSDNYRYSPTQGYGYAASQTLPTVPSNLPPRDATNEQTHATPDHLRRTVVAYATREAPGTIVIDTGNTYLYYVLGQGRAIRYGVGVGREGFDWSGAHSISRKTEWPDWYPPAEMIARQPYLPRFVAGGETNPLGARAMYLGSSIYRIHGTNDPTTIGKFVSSGCIRMTNEDVVDLFERVNIGTKVVVLPKSQRNPIDAYAAMPARDVPPPVSRQLPVRSRVTSGLY